MLNIGIDITPILTRVRSGVAEYTYELLNALFHIDNQNQYFLFYNAFRDVSIFLPDWRQKNVHIVKTRWPNKLFHLCVQLFGFPKVDKVLQKKTGACLDYFVSFNLGFQSLTSRTKHILTLHDLSFEIFPQCFSPKMQLWHRFLSPRRQCQKANLIFAPSENTKRDIVDIYKIDKNKIKVLTPGISTTFFSNSKLSVADVRDKYHLPEKYILFLGTIEPRKNIEGLLQGFESFCKDNGEYTLIIAGVSGWKNKAIFRMIAQMPKVEYIGTILPEEKPALYQGARLFVYPSLYEGFGFPLLEAMASGVPVITSNRSSLPEISGNCAYFVNPENTFEITTGMHRILEDTSLHKFFVEKGLDHVKQFVWEKTAQQFLSSLL